MWGKMENPTIVYDLDTSGGLMEQIQTLLAPPKSEDGEKKARKPDRSTRRAGRASNHETCDSCREGGDLLCCDHCPAAFHLQCCNPPLSREMLPPGDWMCHRCTVRKKKREQKKEQINGLLEPQLGRQMPSPTPEQECGILCPDPSMGLGSTGLRAAVAQVRLLERRPSSRPATPNSNTSSTDTPTPSEQNDMEEDLLDVEDEAQGSEPEISNIKTTLKRPFDLLIAAAMQRNPTQFQLPTDLTCTTAFPGNSKRRRKDELSGKNVKRPQHELDHCGLVPLPVKVCYTCSRTCRLAPLIQCDYCPLLFHMDCLDPPLTAFPTGRWMCPNHIQNLVLNQRTLTLSNRCQLFDQFQDRISQHAVKLDFLQQIHQQHPPTRRSAHANSRKTLKVPDAIKSQYQNPPTLMAPAGVREGELICSSLSESFTPQHLASEDEQCQWLKDVISLQCSIMRHLWNRQTSPWDSEHTEKTDLKLRDSCQSATSTGSQNIAPKGSCSSCTDGLCQNCKTTNGPVDRLVQSNGMQGPDRTQENTTDHDIPRLHMPNLPNHTNTETVIKTENASLKSCNSIEVPPPACVKSKPSTPSCDPGKTALVLDAAAAAKLLASTACSGAHAVKPQKIITDTESKDQRSSDGNAASHPVIAGSGEVFSYTEPNMLELSGRIKDLMQGSGEVELGSLDEKFIKLLAWQRIQQLFKSKASPVQSSSPLSVSPTHRKPSEAQNKEVQARASFCSASGKGTAVNMCYRSLYIGTGADMDVCLKNYGHCNYVSGKHACIFYDENTKQYELLNYSEHGTTVDNVLYSCDFSEKMSQSTSNNLLAKVQNIIRRCRKKEQEESSVGIAATTEDGVMSCESQDAPITPCNCKNSGSSYIGGSGAGWEGTALLHHGSHIKLGCLQFIFSITEFANKSLKEEFNTCSLTPTVGQQGEQLNKAMPPSLQNNLVT
ncbi:PHD finger protein 12 isoform X1 [Carassius gibelio]|uniref:PHD finger protein 12 isoform X1 n=1 Tax=Carassius gibelio TaxID=101364 RepID=UPI002277FF1F|nr:PHD finger protein 12 isoform X1 [Carassius gibelio]